VLISPNFPALESWASENKLLDASRAGLVQDPKVLAEYRAIIKTVNQTLAPFEQIKRIVLVPDEWSIDTGELTPSMKLKRRVVQAKYQAQISEIYREEPVAAR
jgi:long-chain acyl-CoA synthetase